MASYTSSLSQLVNLGLLGCELTAVISFHGEAVLCVTSVQYMFDISL